MKSASPALPPSPLKRLLDRSQPFCKEDVLWALDYMKRKAADGAPEWSGLDRPQLLEVFACFAEMSLLLLHRQTPGKPETERFRAMLEGLFARDPAQL
ncbi:hypothetical protein [Cohnella caldifontis]|uniref:hypothetical protein n=1 Tax=Cohnella caldifontis TaxID=3027471 RepID=UPI0023EE22A4|nr:hypothetical protein [Cohnella sp. YIM B05605]